MATVDDRDKQLGFKAIELGFAPKDALTAAFRDPRRSQQFDICDVLLSTSILTPQQAQDVRKACGIASPILATGAHPILPTPRPTPPSTVGFQPTPQPSRPPEAGSDFSPVADFQPIASVGPPSLPSGSQSGVPTRGTRDSKGSRGSLTTPSPALGDSQESSVNIQQQRVQITESYRRCFDDDPLFHPHADVVFRREDKLGEGGMGVVYRVTDERLGRVAALKTMQRRGQRAVKRFRREVQITAGLDHPAIPPVYEAGINGQGEHYMLMRVIEGQTLEELIKQYIAHRDSHDLKNLLEALVKVGQAIAYAHTQGIIHRDLKPSNIMVGAFGEVMVMDWGLALNLRGPDLDKVENDPNDDSQLDGDEAKTNITRDGASLGTPGYMSPEQCLGERADARSDIFALGAVLTEVLTGRHPVDAKVSDQIVNATVAGNIQTPRQRDGTVPAELNSIAKQALAFDKELRTASTEVFVSDLQNYLSGNPVSAHNYSSKERFFRFLRRNPGTLLVGVFALVLLFLGVLFFSELRRKDEQARATKALLAAESIKKELAQENVKRLNAEKAVVERKQASALEREEMAKRSVLRIQETLELFAKARVMAIRGARVERVEATIEEALKKGGKSLALLMTAAEIYELGKHWSLARATLNEACRLHPPAYLALFYLHRIETRNDPPGSFRFTKSLKRLTRLAQERGDENEFTLFSKACEAQQQRNFKEALALYSQIEKYTQSFSWAYVNRGVIHYLLGNKKNSIEDFNRALQLDPSLYQVYNNRGFARYELQDYEGSIRDYNRAIALKSDFALAYANRAVSYSRLGKRDEAMSDANRAVEMNPQNSQNWGARANVLRHFKEYDGALKNYNKAIGMNSNSARNHRFRAEVRAQLGDYTGAVVDMENYLRLRPSNTEEPALRLKIEEWKKLAAQNG